MAVYRDPRPLVRPDAPYPLVRPDAPYTLVRPDAPYTLTSARSSKNFG